MILNYFQIVFRTIRRNPAYSFLNILGLSLGVAAFLFIVQYVSFERSYDNFHPNINNLYRVAYSFTYFKNGITTRSAQAPPRAVAFMKETMPEVNAYARVSPVSSIVISGNGKKIRQDKALMAEPEFLNLFFFPLVSGNRTTALTKINSILLSEKMAAVYFGAESPVGKTMGVDGVETYTVTGVFRDVPENSHLKFDFLISYETMKAWTEGNAETSWWHDDYYEYVLLEPGTNVASFDNRFNAAYERERGKINKEENSKQEFHLQALSDIHLYSTLDKEPDAANQGNANTVFFLSIIGVCILVMSWINYINLATARAVERAKEVGIRKTLGAIHRQLLGQFMIESMVMNVMAVTAGLLIVVVAIPAFNAMAGSNLTTEFLLQRVFWLNALAFVSVATIVAGLYPSLVLSSYQPIVVLKGKFSAGTSGTFLRKFLVVFQFAASVMLIAGTIIVFRQLDFMKGKDVGFDMNDLLVIRGPGVRDDEIGATRKINSAFINELSNYPEVKSVSGGSTVPGKEIMNGVVIKRREDPESMFKFVTAAWIGYDYFSTLNIKLLAGRTYSRENAGDSTSAILNESAAKLLGFASAEDAVGKKISFGIGQVWTVIGVVADFHQMSVHEKIRPMLFDLYAGYSPLYFVRLEKGVSTDVVAKIKARYTTLYPRDPFDYYFLDESFNRQYQKDERFSRVFTLFASLAILVSCLGLFGLTTVSMYQRTKEIGIRKVLGASAANLTALLSRDFLAMVALSNIIAWPLVYYIMDQWLNHFASRITIHPMILICSGLITMLVALVTVSFKTIRAAHGDPVKALRYE